MREIGSVLLSCSMLHLPPLRSVGFELALDSPADASGASNQIVKLMKRDKCQKSIVIKALM